MTYIPTEEAAVRWIYEHAPVCMVCGQRIACPEDAVRIETKFRLKHREPCTPLPPRAA